MIAPNRPHTFAEFYQQTFRPDRVAGKAPTTMAVWDRGVRIFLQFAGDDVELAAINESRLTEFTTWTREQGIGDITITSHARCVRSILRESEPVVVDDGDDEQRAAARRLAANSDAADGTLMQYLETQYVMSHDLAVRSIEHYRSSVHDLEKFVGRPVLLSELADDLINRYLDAAKERGLSPSTVRGRRTDVLCLWRYADLDGLVDTAPRRIRRIKIPRERITAWSLDEVAAILRASETLKAYTTIENSDGPVTFDRGKLLKSFVMVGWDTALRCGDLLRLKRSDIDDDGRIALVQHKTDSPHVCKVRPETIAAIDETFLHSRERIFPVKRPWINIWLGNLVDRAGLAHDHRKAQKLRRSSGSHVEAIQPGAGSQHLGHAPQGLFGRHYEDISISRAEPTLPPAIPGYQAIPPAIPGFQVEADGNGNDKPATPPPLPSNGEEVPSCE